MRALLQAISPTTNAHRIRRPLFIAQGANDPRVPQSEADQMVHTIRENPEAGEVWYFLARDEGHGFRKKSNRDLYNNAVALFLREHLLPEPQDGPVWGPPWPPPGVTPATPQPTPAPVVDEYGPIDVPPQSAGGMDAAPLEAPVEDAPIDVLDPLPQPEEP